MNLSETNIPVREPHFAGQFYPGSKKVLQSEVNGLMSDARSYFLQESSENLQALIVPHAGYVFSGKVAATAYVQIKSPDLFKRVFILASSHRYSFNGAAVFTTGNYSTPLGEIMVDNEVSLKLSGKSNLFTEYRQAHEMEHSIEVQLPFLQQVFREKLKIVPIIVGTNSAATCMKIAEELKPWFNAENLWIISSDFSHYPKYDDAIITDEATATAICSNQPEKLLGIIRKNESLGIKNLATSLCGWTSVLILMYMSKGNHYQIRKIHYQNSGDAKIYGERARVVGYWSIGVSRIDNTFGLTIDEKAELLEKARKSVEYFVKTGMRPKPEKPVTNGMLKKKAGAFVSIYVKGQLRGCIGGFAGSKTLNEVVQNMAASASCDRRFIPVQTEELDKMSLEISVLSPLKKIKSVEEIELGKHGIFIKSGFNSGTFLPQVAMKTNWTLEEFLGHCSRDKAGIGWEGWKKAEIFIYEAVIVKED